MGGIHDDSTPERAAWSRAAVVSRGPRVPQGVPARGSTRETPSRAAVSSQSTLYRVQIKSIN